MQDSLNWDNPDAKTYLDELGGSKSGAHAYLNDAEPELQKHLPSGAKYCASGEDIDKFLKKGLDYSIPKIVRGCHRFDVNGMVDVIPTEINITGKENVRAAILSVLNTAQDPEVKSFVEYESGETFHGDIGVLVQDFCGRERGSIIEHPHQKGIFRICHVVPVWGSGSPILEEGVFDEQGQEIPRTVVGWRRNNTDEQSIPLHLAQRIIHLYQRIRDTGLMPSSHSFQMEFGVHNKTKEIMFYQSRLFRPFSPKADFDPVNLDIPGRYLTARTFQYDAFGTTSAEGEKLSVAELTQESIAQHKDQQKIAYGYNAYGNRYSTPLNVQPHNLHAFLPYGYQILEHGYYRWMQKAPIALAGIRRKLADHDRHPHPYGNLESPVQNIDEQIKIRIISNGISALIARIDD